MLEYKIFFSFFCIALSIKKVVEGEVNPAFMNSAEYIDRTRQKRKEYLLIHKRVLLQSQPQIHVKTV